MMGTTLFIFAIFAVTLITKNDITKDHPLVLLYFPAVPEVLKRTFGRQSWNEWKILLDMFLFLVGTHSISTHVYRICASNKNGMFSRHLFTPVQTMFSKADSFEARHLQAFFTLFQIVTLDSWTGISRPLGETSPLAGIIIATCHGEKFRQPKTAAVLAWSCNSEGWACGTDNWNWLFLDHPYDLHLSFLNLVWYRRFVFLMLEWHCPLGKWYNLVDVCQSRSLRFWLLSSVWWTWWPPPSWMLPLRDKLLIMKWWHVRTRRETCFYRFLFLRHLAFDVFAEGWRLWRFVWYYWVLSSLVKIVLFSHAWIGFLWFLIVAHGLEGFSCKAHLRHHPKNRWCFSRRNRVSAGEKWQVDWRHQEPVWWDRQERHRKVDLRRIHGSGWD